MGAISRPTRQPGATVHITSRPRVTGIGTVTDGDCWCSSFETISTVFAGHVGTRINVAVGAVEAGVGAVAVDVVGAARGVLTLARPARHTRAAVHLTTVPGEARASAVTGGHEGRAGLDTAAWPAVHGHTGVLFAMVAIEVSAGAVAGNEVKVSGRVDAVPLAAVKAVTQVH